MSPLPRSPKPLVIEPTQAHIHTIIALHGQGSNGPEFAEELFEGKSSSNASLADHFPECKWIFPSSRKRYSTLLQREIDGWFDVASLTDPNRQEQRQAEGLGDSVAYILQIVNEEVQSIHPSNVVLLGFSQGCATAIHAFFAGQYRLGGFVGLNGWMPFREQLLQEAQSCAGILSLELFYERTLKLRKIGHYNAERNATAPALLVHCADDEVVNVELGEQMRDALMTLDVDVTFKKLASGGHWIPGPEGFDIIVDFLRHQAWM
ncbi:MAG: hypothetical protein LQ348_007351 [Seirophora lacunosa]|nr:MAG: hypothetical protein LQ348_007351 [Seirophora lacunosa]